MFVLSQKRLPLQRVSAVSCWLSIVLLLSVPAWAQQSVAPAPAAPQPEPPKDALGRTTPRSAVLGFFSAGRKGEDELAVQYLNTKVTGEKAVQLAHQLFTILDRRLPPKLNELSNKPEGSLANPLKPDQELVGTIASGSGNVDIFLERVNRGDSGHIWLFSNKTLSAIPDLYDESNFALEGTQFVIPEFLLQTRWLGIPLFQYLAVFVLLPLSYFLTGLVSSAITAFVGGVRRRVYKRPDLANPDFLPPPIRLLFLAYLIRWTISMVSLPLFARQFWSGAVTAMIIAAVVWLVILVTGYGEERINRRLLRQKLSGASSMLRLSRRVADVLVVFVGVLVTLYYFGVDLTAALAGLGVGGIALALAAQKTLENVIAGASLIFDRTLNAGDTVKVGDSVGTIEDIGLRSTRIRTPGRTLVSVPNGQVASMTLENLSSRDKFWFHHILSLSYGTTSPQIHSVLTGIRGLLAESRQLEPTSLRVNFLRVGPGTLDVEVFAYVLAADWPQFLRTQEELLLRIIEFIESIEVHIAPPPNAMIAVASTSNDARLEPLKPATGWKSGGDVTPAKSA